MKEEIYLHILKEMAEWRVVPGCKPGAEVRERLAALLGGVPCYLSPGGDLFIGAGSPENLPRTGICLRAPLPGGGGLLKRSADGKFLFSEVAGLAGVDNMIGRRFGAFPAGGGPKLFDLEVEMSNAGSDRPALFFLPDRTSLEAFTAAGRAVLTQPSSFDLSGDTLSCWNLSALANAALLVCLMKENSGRPGLAGVLQFTAAAAPAGLFPVDLWPQTDPDAAQDHGFEFRGPGMDAPKELAQSAEKLSIPAGAASVAARIKIENAGNRARNGALAPEQVPAGRLRAYSGLVETLVKNLAGLEFHPAPAGGSIEVVDEVPGMEGVISGAADFADFLANAAPRLAEVYGRHGLVPGAIKSSSFEKVSAALKKAGPALRPAAGDLRDWAAECREAVGRLVPVQVHRRIKIVAVLMLPVPSVSSDSGEEIRVFLSPDQIGGGKVKEALFSELSFRLVKAALEELGLPVRLVRFYAEGARAALPASLFGGGIAEQLGLSQERFAGLAGGRAALKEKLAPYLSGETMTLYEGKHHRYFQHRRLGDPYSPGQEEGGGSFLAALEVSELIAAGKFNEKILSL